MKLPDNIKEKKSPVIVFDLGGVLMDWNPYYLYCDTLGYEKQAVNDFFQEVDFFTWNIEQDRGRTFAAATEELSTRFPKYREMICAFDRQFLDTLKGPIQPVVDILGKLKSAGYPLYALSNWAAEKFHQVRPAYPFFDWFDGMVISGEVGLVKPGKDIFEFLLKQIGRPAKECVFIDDHEPNILTARELGFQTIHFQSAEQLERDLQDYGVHYM